MKFLGTKLVFDCTTRCDGVNGQDLGFIMKFKYCFKITYTCRVVVVAET